MKRNFNAQYLMRTSRTAGSAIASPMPATFSPSMPEMDGGPDDFRMAVLGDSILWGLGLRDENKICTKLIKWLETEVFGEKQRAVRPTILAHSGARILPAFDKKKNLRTAAVSPEVGSSNPSILHQIDLAAEEFKRKGVSPDKVKLVIVNGGANDLQIYNLFIMLVPRERIIRKARQFCYEAMFVALKRIADTFPNAMIMVPGYYQLISRETEAADLPESLFGLVGLRKLGTIIHIPFDRIPIVRNLLANRSDVWKVYSDLELQAAVDDLNRTRPMHRSLYQKGLPRAVFVPSPFTPENSYAAPETYLWKLIGWGHCNDETRPERKQLSKLEGKKRMGKSLCDKGAFGHPNVEGAHAYFEAIKSKLEPMIEHLGWLDEPVN